MDKTKQYLSQAKENLTARYRDPIMNGFNKYYEMLTGCLPREYKMDANISLTKEESGGRRQITALSSGWQDLVNICLRMALVDAMYKEEKPFLVMDDPFVNLDKEKWSLPKGSCGLSPKNTRCSTSPVMKAGFKRKLHEKEIFNIAGFMCIFTGGLRYGQMKLHAGEISL